MIIKTGSQGKMWQLRMKKRKKMYNYITRKIVIKNGDTEMGWGVGKEAMRTTSHL